MEPPLPIIDVAAALLFRDGRLLIAQRHMNAHLGGLWEFPGGKREQSETFEQALVRKMEEELGVRVSIGELIDSITHSYPEKTVRLRFYRCTLQNGEPQALGCPAIQWVGPKELSHYEFPAADAQLLDKLRQTPGLWR